MSTVDPIEQAKRQRSAAKGRFTRIENQLSRKLIEEPDVSTADLICMVLDDLKEAWKNVNDKHESYMDVITDVTADVTEENEKWIEDVQNRFYEVQQRCKIFKKKANNAAMVESARKARDLSYNNFHQLCVNTRSSLREDVSRETLERERKNLCIQFDYVAKLHNELLLILGSEMEADKTFYIKMYDEYSDMNKSIDNLVCKLEELKLSDASGSKHKSVVSTSQRNLQLEKIPLPSFDGDIRQYSRFRSDFVEMVMPTVNSKKQAAFVLRQCLSKSIVQSISSCEDDVDKILQRLDDKYADPGKVTDSIINDIRKFKTIESYNSRRLIEFINLIEWGYNDLKALKLETEICNANVVSLVESKLPKELALDWYRKIYADNSGIQTTNKFPHILKFLVIERRALEYGLSDFRVSNESKYGKVNEVTSGSYATKSFGQNSNCLIHNNASHVTSECRGYLRMSLNERYYLLRENFACYTCLKPKHLSIDCKDSKACGEDNCEKTHHPSLHQSEVSSIHNSISGDTTSCRLQIMSIPVKGRQYGKLNVFWDSGSTISLIRNAKARELKLKGTPVTLNITTVGGVKRKEYSSIYHVPLVDTNGCTRMITAYGIDKVMNDINDVSTEEFKGVFNEDEIKSSFYQCGPIDLLIGLDYAIWHPVKVEVRQNFVVLSNIFGMCIGVEVVVK